VPSNGPISRPGLGCSGCRFEAGQWHSAGHGRQRWTARSGSHGQRDAKPYAHPAAGASGDQATSRAGGIGADPARQLNRRTCGLRGIALAIEETGLRSLATLRRLPYKG
jgi:hypothetical protein